MLYAKLREAKSHAEYVAGIVVENEKLRITSLAEPRSADSPDIIDYTYWRTYDYCAAVVRLYAGMERFIFEAIRDWLAFLSQNDASRVFSSSLAIERYKYGAGEIFRRSKEIRFSSVDLPAVAETLVNLIRGISGNSIVADGFFAALPNLRLSDIVDLLRSVTLSEPDTWISNFSPLGDFCRNSNITTESQLKDLVERRNEAAHGNELPSDTLSPLVLKELSEFVSLFCEAIYELIAWNMSSHAILKSNMNAKIGIVVQSYPKHKACLLVADQVPFNTGTEVLVISGKRCFVTKITSIQLEGDNYAGVSPNPGDQIGLGLSNMPKEGDCLYRLDLLKLLNTVSM